MGGVGPSENCVTWGYDFFLLGRGDKPVKGGVDVEMGALPLFHYLTVPLCLLCVWVK